MKLLSFVIAFSCLAFALAEFTTGAVPTTTSQVTTATTPKPNPNPPLNKYNVTDGNVTQKWEIDASASVDEKKSNCDKLVVVFERGEFAIEFRDDGKNTFISGVTANLTNPAMQTSASNLTDAKATEGSSYKCSSGFDIGMSHSVTFKMTDVQLQPHSVKGDKFGQVENCNDLSGIVPIIVGAVLAGLVVIVVVAYFIGRSRNRTGYEEI